MKLMFLSVFAGVLTIEVTQRHFIRKKANVVKFISFSHKLHATHYKSKDKEDTLILCTI